MEKNRSYNSKKRQNKIRWSRRARINGHAPQEGQRGGAGYVYIFDVGDGLYKIGVSGNWQSRMATLGASNPNIRIVMAIRVGSAKQCEMHLHVTFRDVHHNREMFRLAAEHLAYAERYLNENAPNPAPSVTPVNPRVAPSGWCV
jgi:hypothetical protein